MHRRDRMRAVAAALALVAAGCSFKSAPTHFYVLSPISASPATTPVAAEASEIIVGIGPVRLPQYLDRLQVVTRTGSELVIAEFDQWAEPLADGVARVLAENLGASVGSDRVIVLPWRGFRVAQYRLRLDLDRLDGTLGGDVVMRGRWRLVDGRGTELALRTINLTERAGAGDYAAFASAMSRLLATASREMATEIRQKVAISADQPPRR